MLNLSGFFDPHGTTLHIMRTTVSATFTTTLLLSLLYQSEAKVVVLLSSPHTANVRSYVNVARALGKHGHVVYVCVPQSLLDTDMVNVTGVRVIPYGDYLDDFDEVFFQAALEKIWRAKNLWIMDFVSMIQTMQPVIRLMLSDQNLTTRLKTVKPDMFILTNGPSFRNIVTLPYMLNVPFVYLGSSNDLPGQRVPFSPSSTPCPGYSDFNDKGMNFADRVGTSVCNIILTFVDLYFMNDKLIEEFAPNRPKISVSTLSKRAELYIIESDHILDYAKPELPAMKLIGSTALAPPSELREPFKSFIEGSEHGVALVTSVKIPESIAEKMALAFQLLDLDVVWRINFTSKGNARLLTAPWVPQNDILAHSKTKLFVSHCGSHSQYEALYHGVPMLCLPLYGDQFYNSDRSKSKGLGLTANLVTISHKQLAKLMAKLAFSEKYRNNIKKASFLFNMLYKLPSDAAAFWIDHVIEHGGNYMRSAAQEMPVYQFLVLDAMTFVFIVIVIMLLVVFLTCMCCFKILGKFLNFVKSKKCKKH
ncbi:hypothetical protein Btru_050843 [Bulinus truncatus]|nr:hypothetical protein Btru_050843 [Bulinus truncatus]